MIAQVTTELDRAVDALRQGAVIICPSEGVYGLSCDATNEKAIRRIIALKKRDTAKGLIMVDCKRDFLNQHLDLERINSQDLALMEANWPGPHTFVVPVNQEFKSSAVRDNHTLAFRVTAFAPLAKLCEKLGKPLISTSANISGQSAVSTLDDLDLNVIIGVDLVIALECGGQLLPSSIYDTLTHTLIRQGPGFKEEI